MRKRSNISGFSLIEVLAVIVILSLIFFVGIFSYKSTIDNSNKTINEQSEKMIFEAVTFYIDEFRHDKDWDEGYNQSNKTAFCISFQTLINMGYYKGNEKNIEKWKDEYLVYVEVDDNSTYNYELINSENSDVCKVTTDGVKLFNQNGNYKFVDAGLEIANLEYKTLKKGDELYSIDNIFSVTEFPEVEEEIKSYITLVLDRSGSMFPKEGPDYITRSEKAASCLSTRLLGKPATEAGLKENECSNIPGNKGLKNTKISLIEFALKPYLSRNFENSILPVGKHSKNNPNAIFHGKDFSGGGTNTAYALMYAMMLNQNLDIDKINQNLPINDKKFIILLYDGQPCQSLYYTETDGEKKITHYPYDADNEIINTTFFENFNSKFSTDETKNEIKIKVGKECKDTQKRAINDLNAISKYLKENTDITLIIVGYRTSFGNNFKEMASVDNDLCSDSPYYKDVNKNKKKDANEDWYCYYKSDGESLNKLFNSLSNNLIREINRSTATKIKVVLTPPENVTFIKNEEILQEIIYDIDLVNKENNNNDYSYDLKIDEAIFDSCTNDKCTVEIDLFNAKIEYYNSEGIKIKDGTIEDVPKLELKYGEFLAIN